MASLWTKLCRSGFSQHHRSQSTLFGYQQYILFSSSSSTKRKRLPKKWKPTTSMFIESPDNPGQFVLSKTHDLHYHSDPLNKSQVAAASNTDGTSLIAEVEATSAERAVDDIEEDQFMKSYKWIIVSVLLLGISLMSGFTMGFTRIAPVEDDSSSKRSRDQEDREQKKKQHSNILLAQLSKIRGDDRKLKQRHRNIVKIIRDLQHTATHCVLIEKESKHRNKALREQQYLSKLDKQEIMDSPQMHESKMMDKVLNNQWSSYDDIDHISVDDIKNADWNFSSYLENIAEDDIRLQLLPPLNAMAYGSAKIYKLVFIFSNKYLEWFQVILSFRNSRQRVKDLNFVAIKIRNKEYHCYPKMLEDGTSDDSQWLVEEMDVGIRVLAIESMRRYRRYWTKKYWKRVDPIAYEIDLDEGLTEFYGRDIFATTTTQKQQTADDVGPEQQGRQEKKQGFKDEDLIKLVERLESKYEQRKKLQTAQTEEANV